MSTTPGASAPTASTGTSVNRWLIVWMSGFLLLGLGAVYSFSVFAGPLGELRGWNPAQVALGYSIQSGIAPIGMVLSGIMVDKGKARLAIALGGGLFGLGYFLTAYASSLGMFYLVFGVISGMGVAIGYGAALSNAIKFFPDKRGTASGIVTGLNGLATVWAAPAFTALIAGTPDRVPFAFRVMGIIFLVITVLVVLTVRQAPPNYAPAGWTPPAPAAGARGATSLNWKQMLATPVFWVIFLIFVAGAFSGLMVTSQATRIGVAMYGIEPALAGAVFVPLLAIANGGGRFVFGPVSDKIGQVRTMMIIFIGVIVALLILLFTKGSALGFGLGVIVLFLTFGGTMGVMPALVMRNFGPAYQGVNYALAFSAYSTAALVGPQIGARIGAEGDYTPAFYIAIAVAIIGFGLSWLCGRLMQRAGK